MSDIVNISRILSGIRNRHRVAILVEINVCPGFLGRIVLIFVVGGDFGRTRVHGDIAAMYCLLAWVVALVESDDDRNKEKKIKRKISELGSHIEIKKKKKKKILSDEYI